MTHKKEFTREVFDKMLEDVVKWNEVGGNDVGDKSLIPTYTKLSREEMFGQNEFLQGWFTGDKVMQADGVGDLIFTAGFLSELSESCDNFIVPPEQYVSDFETEEVVAMLCESLIVTASHALLREHLFAFCLKMSEYMDVESIFKEISASNFSKFVPEDELYGGFCLDGEVELIESQGRYGGVSYKRVGEYWVFTAERDLESGVVFDKPKVVKPSTFKEPNDLGRFIY